MTKVESKGIRVRSDGDQELISNKEKGPKGEYQMAKVELECIRRRSDGD